MMNEYRAWSKEKEIMVYMNEDDNELYMDNIMSRHFMNPVELLNELLCDFESDDNFILMQKIYEKKNGQVFYDGDILEDGNTLWYIKKDDYFLGYVLCRCNGRLPKVNLTKGMLDDMKKIGNIYEDKELLG